MHDTHAINIVPQPSTQSVTTAASKAIVVAFAWSVYVFDPSTVQSFDIEYARYRAHMKGIRSLYQQHVGAFKDEAIVVMMGHTLDAIWRVNVAAWRKGMSSQGHT